MGLENNSSIPNKNQRIHAYDIFIWSTNANMQQSVIGTALEGKYQDGDSFLDEYRQRISPWNDLVQVYPGDITELSWHQTPIEFLFKDRQNTKLISKSKRPKNRRVLFMIARTRVAISHDKNYSSPNCFI